MSRQPIIDSLKEEIKRRTPKSGMLNKKAEAFLPNGNISSVRDFEPWPFFMEKADSKHKANYIYVIQEKRPDIL